MCQYVPFYYCCLCKYEIRSPKFNCNLRLGLMRDKKKAINKRLYTFFATRYFKATKLHEDIRYAIQLKSLKNRFSETMFRK